MAMAGLFGCEGESRTANEPLLRMVPTKVTQAVEHTGGSPQAGGESTIMVPSDGAMRDALLYVPKGYDPSFPTPLILNFHPLLGTPEIERNLSGMNTLADRVGALVVYPRGINLAWNAGTCCTLDLKPRDDVGYVRSLLDVLGSNYRIDRRRIYATGMSNGSAFSFRLACELADLIAAFAPVAAPMMMSSLDSDKHPENCRPSRPTSIQFFVGTEDIMMRLFHPPYEWARHDMDAWAQRERCARTPVFVEQKGDARFERYPGCDGAADLQIVSIEGGGHTWPGGNPTLDFFLGKTSRDINANDVMWTFFQAHPLP
jgi:polyhydroxybutyrate depolymerase